MSVETASFTIRQRQQFHAGSLAEPGDFFVAHRTARREDGLYTGFSEYFRSVGKRKEAVAVCDGTFEIMSCVARIHHGDLARADARRLRDTHAQQHAVFDKDDRVAV